MKRSLEFSVINFEKINCYDIHNIVYVVAGVTVYNVYISPYWEFISFLRPYRLIIF